LKTIALGLALLTISGCSLLGPKEVEIITKPVQIDIVQPVLPRPIDLKEPKWYVVSDSVIIENCLKDPETKKSNCKLGREDLYPDGYTYLDKFIDDIKKNHGGDIVFFAMTVDDYELMAFNTQEIKRYINQLGEVIVYYRNVTINDNEGGAVEIKVEKNGDN
tara:strand:+ start:317 stop:802 length:486 start_codon:yes stop_codon:yes gene_type:complete